MKPIQHVNARTIAAAVQPDYEQAMFIAGGTDCLSILKNDVLPAYPEALVNLKTIPGLEYIREDAAGLRIGALTTLAEIAGSPAVAAQYGCLAEATRSVASPQIRNMGTLGGNLCQDVRCWYYRCSPLTGKNYVCQRKGGRLCYAVAGDNRYQAIMGGKGCFAVCPSDTAVALAALDATLAVQGPEGERSISLQEFYTPLGNTLKPHELVAEVRIPRPLEGARQTFLKFRLRKAIDFALVSVASVITLEKGVCKDARIALGAVAPAPVRASEAEAGLRGKNIDGARAEEAALTALVGARPLKMNAYKVEIAKTLVKRAILACTAVA